MDFEFPTEIPPIDQSQDLPITFCVKTHRNAIEGYYLMRWSHGGLDTNNKIIHILKPGNHMNSFYNISHMASNMRWNIIISRKNSGNITRTINWRFAGQKLVHEDINIPIICITPMSTSLPNMPTSAFIPITQPEVPQNIPTNIIVPTKYPIGSIPNHVIASLLRDAAMQEEVCPITSEEIDIANGAVTSCFHLFEKNAIMKWLSMPNSGDNCPVCNRPCNSYTLDEPPPLNITS